MNPDDAEKSGEELQEIDAFESDQRLRLKTANLFGNVRLTTFLVT